ncbi:MAG: heavy metal translocating P-type ATPase [Bacillota bacterium]
MKTRQNGGAGCPACPFDTTLPGGAAAGVFTGALHGSRGRPFHPGMKAALLGFAALAFTGGLIFRSRLQMLPAGIYLDNGLFILIYLLVGYKIIWKAVRNLIRGRVLDEYFLMTAATAGAIALGEVPEAAAVALFFSVGRFFEDLAVNRACRSIAAVMENRPDYANLVDADGREKRVTPESVLPGQEIIIRPGEKIPLDGMVLQGGSYVDNAALTGESVPRRVEPGDTVAAGGNNGSGLLRIRVTRPFGESSLAAIFRLVQEAAGRKAKTERLITGFARYYTPAVVLSAVGLAVLPPLLWAGASFSEWLYRALVLLVISCPCALVISVPLSYFGGIGSASRSGILIKGARYLEALLQVDTVVFDKTGTLTKGVFKVIAVHPQPAFTRAELLFWAAHAEYYAHHPAAASIRDAYRGTLAPEVLGRCAEIKGFGVRAEVSGKTVLAGSGRFLQREGVAYSPCAQPGSVIYVAVDGSFAGCLVIADEIKEDAAAAVRLLKKLGVRRIIMLTGDSRAAAAETAAAVTVDRYESELLPEQKVACLEALLDGNLRERKGKKGKLAFVGDGFNDAPSLSRADVGIAMGGLGSDAAVETADVVIMDDRLSKVARALEIAAFTRWIVVQNIVLALGVKGIFVIIGIMGTASIWEAVFADVGVALLAIVNAARALRFKSRIQDSEFRFQNYP